MTAFDREPYLQLPMIPYYARGMSAASSLHTAAGRHANARHDHALIRRPGGDARKQIYIERSKAIRAGNYGRETLLKEVTVRIKRAAPEVEALYRLAHGTAEAKPVTFAGRAIEGFLAHIERSWDPTAKHVVMFSSGYDSRLLGALLKKIADERGVEWLGDTRFCCFQPEVAYAKRVYDHIGLPAEMWWPITPDAPAKDYYKSCLDFNTIGAQLSESERFWGGALLIQLTLGDWLNGHVQGISALFSDETSKWNRKRWSDIGWFIGCYLFDNPGILPGRPDIPFIFPFASVEWIKLVTKYRLPMAVDDCKLEMIKQLDVKLADTRALPNFRFQIGPMRVRNGGFEDQQRISKATAEAMENAYRASWYAQKFGPAVLDYQNDRVFRYYDDRNVHYLKAAIFDHLRKHGTTLS